MNFIPKSYKFPKAHKGRVSFLVYNLQPLSFGEYGLVAKQSARISASQIAAAVLAMKRKLKKEGEIFIRVYPHIPVTAKPAEVRMGKGKGSVNHWIARVRSGMILFEISAPNENLAKLSLQLASSKLPIKTSIISKSSPSS